MSFELTTFKIGDIADVQTGPFGSQLHKEDYVLSGTPIITVEHLGENKIIHENTPFVSDDDVSRLAKYTLRERDIVFSRVGSVDRRAYVSKEEDGWLFSGRCLRVRVKKQNMIEPKYLSYYFGLERFKEYIRGIAVGATMPSLNTKILSEVYVKVPSLQIQREIAQLLSALDEKMDINKAINKNLEAMAQTLFKRWFVDFEFPNEDGEPYKSSGGEFEESELGLIPKGWKTCTLGEIIKIKHGYAFKSENFSEKITSRILLTPGNFKIGGGFNDKKLKYYRVDADLPEEYVLKRGDLLVTMTDLSKKGDTLGYPAILPNVVGSQLIHNQRLGKVSFSSDLPLRSFIYNTLCSSVYRGHILGTATGSTVKHTAPSRIESFKIILPDRKSLDTFESIAYKILEMSLDIFEQNNQLELTRDSLLPKLMSGEIRVPIEQE